MICPITYEPLQPSERYSKKGLHLLSPKLEELKDFPYSAEDQRREAEAHSSKLSIQGVQPKLSVTLSVKSACFEIVDRNGRYILKPQVERYKNLPENEDLTMRLAETIGIEVPFHGLVYSKDGSLTYFIRRFDRKSQKSKLQVEDFAQLGHASRDTKYDSTMEKVAKTIEQFCTFPALEKRKLFQRILFVFLTGNEDMHLKNFSLIVRDGNVEVSPAYDLVNTTIVLPAVKEELALSVRGKKNRITRADLIDYFAIDRLSLNKGTVDDIIEIFQRALPSWGLMVEKSFLSAEQKKRYLEVVTERAKRLNVLAL